MRKPTIPQLAISIVTCVALLRLAMLAAFPSRQGLAYTPEGGTYHAGRLTVEFKPGVSRLKAAWTIYRHGRLFSWVETSAYTPPRTCVVSSPVESKEQGMEVYSAMGYSSLFRTSALPESIAPEEYRQGVAWDLMASTTEQQIQAFQDAHPELSLRCELNPQATVTLEDVRVPKGSEAKWVETLENLPEVDSVGLVYYSDFSGDDSSMPGYYPTNDDRMPGEY